jgi:hypothetical protein
MTRIRFCGPVKPVPQQPQLQMKSIVTRSDGGAEPDAGIMMPLHFMTGGCQGLGGVMEVGLYGD